MKKQNIIIGIILFVATIIVIAAYHELWINKYERVRTGVTREEVISLLNLPFISFSIEDKYEIFYYLTPNAKYCISKSKLQSIKNAYDGKSFYINDHNKVRQSEIMFFSFAFNRNGILIAKQHMSEGPVVDYSGKTREFSIIDFIYDKLKTE